MSLEVQLEEQSAGALKASAKASSDEKVKRSTQISVGGVRVRVRTDATPAEMKEVRDLVDGKYQELEAKLTRGVSSHELALLVALNLAEELLEEREKLRLFKRQVLESSERLIGRVESHLNTLG